jgi:MFS family permease
VSERGAGLGRRDVPLLFATRIARLFAYGFLSVVLVLYLGALGFDGPRTGLLLTSTLLGDAAITLWITSRADRVGRRRMLLLGAVLMAAGGLVFLATRNPWLLILAAIVGVISPSGNEIGPFLAIEQAALSEVTVDRERTRLFAWYNVAGSGATALGALAGGWLTSLLQHRGLAELDSYRVLLAVYALLGCALGGLFAFLSPAVEVKSAEVAGVRRWLGLHRSRGIVARLSALFGLDAFAGGFILQSVVAYWFHARFGATPATLGTLFFAANVLAAISALVASSLAARIGLVQTMVFTHLPANVLLMTVPWMPTLPLAMAMYLIRSSISQMDVPTRQSYTVAVVSPDERAAASGVTAIARSIGAAAAPWVGGAFLLTGVGAPFYVAGSLKIVYDLLLFRSFRGLKPPEEAGAKMSA